jgi:hypothetical protein
LYNQFFYALHPKVSSQLITLVTWIGSMYIKVYDTLGAYSNN